MAQRKIKWTVRAIAERNKILDYWYFRNKSVVYPRKLNSLFTTTINLIAQYPEAGKLFNRKGKIYFVLVKSYRIYYLFNERELVVLSLWDTRRNPSKIRGI